MNPLLVSVRTPTSLVERAKTGDHEAFGSLVELTSEHAYRIARAILGNDEDAWDATQDAFVRAWRELPTLRDPERFDVWLRAITVNGCRQAMRGRRRRLVREIAVADPSEAVPAPGLVNGPDEEVALADALERALERLDANERAILVLHHLEHLPVDVVAATLGIPVGTVKSRLFAARHALERALEVELR
jgi:RNA polymerase sigma-70 factor (ECF subfamily)